MKWYNWILCLVNGEKRRALNRVVEEEVRKQKEALRAAEVAYLTELKAMGVAHFSEHTTFYCVTRIGTSLGISYFKEKGLLRALHEAFDALFFSPLRKLAASGRPTPPKITNTPTITAKRETDANLCVLIAAVAEVYLLNFPELFSGHFRFSCASSQSK